MQAEKLGIRIVLPLQQSLDVSNQDFQNAGPNLVKSSYKYFAKYWSQSCF